MRKSSTVKSKTLQNPQLSIDLKPLYNEQSGSDQEEIFDFDDKQKTKHNKKRSQNNNGTIEKDSYNSATISKYTKKYNDYYSDNNNDDLEYNDYDVPGTRTVPLKLNQQNSQQHNRRHNSHRHHHKPNPQSSKLYKSIYYESLNKKPNHNIINTGEMLAIAKSQIQENFEKRKNNNDDFQFLCHQRDIENNFDNDNNYYKIPYKNRDLGNIIDSNDDNSHEDDVNLNNFDEVYHFSTKQFIKNDDDQTKNDDNNTINNKKQEDKSIKDNDYQRFDVQQKMVFHDSDQLDDSLNIFIEEEEYFENKQGRARKNHKKDTYHKKHRHRLIPANLNEFNTDESNYRNYNIISPVQRKPLNETYQKFMNPKSQAESIDNYEKIDFKSSNYDNKVGKNGLSEYSNYNILNKSHPNSNLREKDNLSSNKLNNAQKISNEVANPNIKFIQSEEIISGKNADFLDSSNDQESPQDDQYRISDLDFIEDINLKITVKDTNESSKEKVHQFNIYSLKNDQQSGKDEFVEEEEEAESESNQISKNNNDFNLEKQPSKTATTSSNERNEKSTTSPTKASNSKNANNIRIDANKLIENDDNKNNNIKNNIKNNIDNKNSNIKNDSKTNNNNNNSNSFNKYDRSRVNNSPSRSPDSNKNSNPAKVSNSSPKSDKNKNRNSSPLRTNKNNANSNSTAARTMSGVKNSNMNANSKSKKPTSQTVGKNDANNDDLFNGKEEESGSSVASFCDISTSFDSQNQLEETENNNQKNDNENDKKGYKTAEINVTLKDIREAVGCSNKSVKKRTLRKRKQSDDQTIVTTHRRRMKRSAYRKRLVHKSIQTEKVDNPSYTLAMLTGY